MPRGVISLEELAEMRTSHSDGTDGADEAGGDAATAAVIATTTPRRQRAASVATPQAASAAESPTERRRRERAEAAAARATYRQQAEQAASEARETKSQALYSTAVAHLQDSSYEGAVPEYVSPFSRTDWLEATGHTASGGSCPACRAGRAASRATFRVVDSNGETLQLTDSAGESYEVVLDGGDRVITKAGHEHEAKRRVSCAICMAIYEHEREVTPTASALAKTPKACACGCGGQTRGGRFLPGHDAKLAGLIRGYQKWAQDNAEAIERGEVEPGAYERISEIPEEIRSMGVEGPGGTCSCCGAPLLEAHDSGMGPICRSGGCTCAARRGAVAVGAA